LSGFDQKNPPNPKLIDSWLGFKFLLNRQDAKDAKMKRGREDADF